jgi:hypothetical protein
MRLASFAALLLAAGACGAPEGAETTRRDSLTQRERASAVAASGLPGAGGVRGALNAADSAAVRGARLDSIALAP